MFGLWLHCSEHKDCPRWTNETNHWGLWTIIKQWIYGYRHFSVSREPKPLR